MTTPDAAAYHGVRAAMPLYLLPCGRFPIVISTAADSPRLSHARFLLPLFQQQRARGYICRTRLYAARLCPTNPHGTVHTAWLPCGFSRNLQTCFPSLPGYPHICFVMDLLLQLLWLLLLLSRSAHGHAARLKILLLLLTARVPMIIIPP